MKYALRSIKYFGACSVLALVLVALMVAFGLADVRLDEWQEDAPRFATLFGLLALLAALYPKLTFTRRRVKCDFSSAGKAVVRNAFRSAGYEPVATEGNCWRFRQRSFIRRLRRLFDDEITVAPADEGWLTLEGHRAEVFRVLCHWDAGARQSDEA